MNLPNTVKLTIFAFFISIITLAQATEVSHQDIQGSKNKIKSKEILEIGGAGTFDTKNSIRGKYDNSKSKIVMPGVPSKENESKKVAYFIDKRSGIPVYFIFTNDTFPAYWKTKKINGKGVSLPKKEYERSKKVIIKALKKYPLTVLKKNLKAIYVLQHLEFYGQLFGGTNSKDTVYLTNKGISKGYTDFYLEQTFHHEFSSIFLRKYPYYFDKKSWLNTNAKEFKYGNGGVNALKTGKTGQYFDPKINEMGLLSQYSTSDMENDLNNFAQNLFLPNKDFANLLIKYERLNQKYKILVDFYTKIDKGFTKEFFDKLTFPNGRPSDNLALPPR